MDETIPNVSDAERDALRALWARGPGRVRDLLAALPDRGWAYSTLQTLLHRLEQKGLVAREAATGGAIYRATVTREELLQRRLTALGRELADDSPVSLLHGIVAGRRLRARELAEMRALLDELEAKSLRKGRGRSS
ncbi:MAG: BlaI/MecI/CopY family transcriptional regulator [Planctomycetes bacterium]|nr:BlaI/MecI/CopY family transcriptional regulator [Planctomycetota bacterium]